MEEKSQDFAEVTDWFSDTSETKLKGPLAIVRQTHVPLWNEELHIWG